MATDLPRLDEIRALLPELPGPDLQAKAAAQARQAEWMKPAADLGRLAETALWLATWQGARPPRMERPRLAIFAANHGVAALGVCDEDSGYSHRMVQYFIAGGAAVNQLAAMLDADLRVYEMALDQPTADFTQGPAMSDEDCARALSYGMMAVEEGFDLMALGEVGLGSTTSAAALCHGLFGGAAADWVAGDSGCDEAMTARRLAVVQRGVAVNQTAFADPFEVLRCLGGLELSALVGAIIACRLAQIPVLLDSFASAAAAAVLHAFDPQLLDHCLVAQRPGGEAADRLLGRIGKRPLLDLGIGGSGAASLLAIQLLRGAVACHSGMAAGAGAGTGGAVDT